MYRILLFVLFLICQFQLAMAQDSTSLLSKDTNIQLIEVKDLRPKNLLDSLAQPENLRHYFFKHEAITKIIERGEALESTRDLPLLKAIQLRNKPRETWKFWTLLSNLLFLALIRLIHIKRFDEIIQSAFDLQADFSQYSDKVGTYVASHTGLFINFIISVSFFISNLLALNHQL